MNFDWNSILSDGDMPIDTPAVGNVVAGVVYGVIDSLTGTKTVPLGPPETTTVLVPGDGTITINFTGGMGTTKLSNQLIYNSVTYTIDTWADTQITGHV